MNIILNKERKASGEVNIDLEYLINYLKESKPGDLIKYEDLNKLISRDVQGSARYILQTARRTLMRDEKIVFDVVMNSGIKRLSDSEVVDKNSVKPFRRIANTIKSSSRELSAVSVNALDYDHSRKMNATQSLLGALALCGKPKAVEQIQKQSEAILPSAKVLELFINN